MYTDSVRSKASTEIMHVCPKHQRNTQRGITLIALIITIIVLLILAVVSIRLVVNNGILGKAEGAVKTYSESETEEKVKLAYSDYQMGKLTNSSYTFEQALQNGKVAYTSVTGSDAEGYIVTATLSDGRTKQFTKYRRLVIWWIINMQ